MQDLSKQIDLNNLAYYFKGKTGPKNFINFKGPLAFYRNIKDGYTTPEKAQEKPKKINQIYMKK